MNVQTLARTLVLVLLTLAVNSCATRDPRVPSAAEQKQLDRQLARVFAGLTPQDASQWAADRTAVEQLHLLCYWIRSYHELVGEYPLASHLSEERSWVQTFVYGDDTHIDYTNPINRPTRELIAELREVLGDDLELPADPDPSSWHGMHYSTSGRGFAAGVDIYHPVNGGEMVTAEHCQYRVASYKGSTVPMHAFEAILSGELTQLAPVQWRDPSQRPAR
jgi:hypothetical protein